MGVRKRNKYKLTDEERETIHEVKKQLSNAGIPRSEWSYHIQQELMLRKKQARKDRSKGESSFFQNLIENFRGRIEKIFQKFMAKRMNMDQQALDELFGDSMAGGPEMEMDMMKAIFSNVEIPKEDQLEKHGTFVAEREDKKRMIIDFDDED